MQVSKYPRAADIRDALLSRAEAFRRITGMPKATIGLKAMNDKAFLFQVEGGRNITLRSYDRVMRWLDKHQPPSLYKRQAKTSRRSPTKSGRN